MKLKIYFYEEFFKLLIFLSGLSILPTIFSINILNKEKNSMNSSANNNHKVRNFHFQE